MFDSQSSASLDSNRRSLRVDSQEGENKPDEEAKIVKPQREIS